MLLYVCGMKTKTIPWEIIEGVLEEIGRDAAWLRKELDVGANVITNWKDRGAPKGRADEIAEKLGTTADFLLQRPGAARLAAAKPQASELEMAIELMSIFGKCGHDDQVRMLEDARAIAERGSIRRTAANKS